MKTKTRTLTAITVVAALGGTALAGASYAGHRGGGGPGFPGAGQFDAAGPQMFDAADTDGDGALTQAEIDKQRGDLHAAHDADSDGSLTLEEFSGLWLEAMRPLTVRAFQTLDTDGDGIVTRAEYDLPLADFVERLDRDGDGSLSIGEVRDDDDDDGRRGSWWGDDDDDDDDGRRGR